MALPAARLMEESEVQQWPLEGPMTLQWLITCITKYGGTPLAWHTRWMAEVNIDESHPHAYAFECLSERSRAATS